MGVEGENMVSVSNPPSPLCVGLEARLLATPYQTGISRYVGHLYEHLSRIPSVQCILLTPSPSGVMGARAANRATAPARFGSLRNAIEAFYWLNVHLPVSARRYKMDVLHCTDHLAPLAGVQAPLVITVCDLATIVLPHMDKWTSRLRMRAFFPLALKQAAHILTISEYSKRELVRLFGVDEHRITVTHLAAGMTYRPVQDQAAIQAIKQWVGADQFILSVGTLSPRKNLPRLVQAFHVLHASAGIAHKLVVVGVKGWLYSDVFNVVQELGLQDQVVFTDYVSEQTLCLLYNAADAFAYVSLYEGFGLPVLEAMACGTPVVTSNTSSIPEVAGGAALFVDPYDVRDISQALFKVLTDTPLRARLCDLGLKRSAGFSWDKTAQQTLDVYQRVRQQSREER